MASIITLDRPELPTKEEGANGVQEGVGVQGSTTKGGSEDIAATGTDGQTTDSISPSPSPGSGSVSLRGTTLNGTSPGPSNAPPLSVPQPKKFSHVNINKKFLEKTSSASSSSPSTSTLVSAKVGSMPQKPTLQTAPSHSRLVTAKLTAGPQPSTVTGPGWSRPSSTNSSVAPTPTATNPKPSPLPASSPNSSAPPPVQFGKIIQPQPRSSDQLSNPKKDGSSKPAWGNARTAGTMSGQSGGVQDEFPTAAEVAQVNTAKLIEKKQAAQAAAAQKQALAAEADAFRGIHLNPGHHWDEDEGDDDNFLENVIDFGDGRQYKIQSTESQQLPPADQEVEASTKGLSTHPSLNQPVSKAERFGDDFDRSWPRNRGSGAFVQRDQQSRGPPSATSSHSPQEGSRVLFNERSNRLEPYSNHRYGAPRDSFPSRRDSRSDYSASPTEMRGGRDLPPHSQRQDGPPRSRVFGDRPGFSSSFDTNPRNRDRDPRRDYPSFGRSTSQGGRSRDGPNSLGLSSPIRGEDRPRRLSTGPIGEPGEEGRQLPPHLSGLRPPQRRSTSSDRRSPLVTTTDLPAAPQSVHSATRSPALSQATLSPLITESPLQGGTGMPLMDIDEVRRAAMHSAAERARLRRQHEEEEREKEKERARRKAAELESKMKVEKEDKEEDSDKVQTDAQVIEIIQDAVQSVAEPLGNKTLEPVPEEPSSTQVLPPIKTTFGRPPSTRGTLRSAQSRRSSFPTPSTGDATSPATDATSWRSKTLPPRPFAQQPPPVVPVVSAVPPTPLLHPEIERQLTIEADEEVEVIDFSEHGRLAGVEPEPPKPEIQPTEPANTGVSERRRPRPLAMDFFEDDNTIAQSAKSDEGSWRRKTDSEPSIQEVIGEVEVVVRERLPQPPASAPIHPTSTARRRLSVSSDDHSRPVSGPSNLPHTPRSPHYREAPMSALDDTMARIKGALDGMQRPEQPPKPQPKWLPPALRPRAPSVHHEDSPVLEIFDVTASDLPRSPKPAWNHFTVKFPAISYPSTPLSKKQIHLSQTQPHVRADIFTWDPPIDGMNRKDFHLNDILFRKPLVNKGQVKYTVVLPGNRPSGGPPSSPVVHLPPRSVSTSPNNAGAFGRRREADGVANWRKPPPSPLKTQTSEEPEIPASLDTVSRSPPPEAPTSATVPSTSASDAPSPAVSVTPSKARSIHKTVVGSDVAFYRDSRSEQSPAEPKSTVNFIVNSELEEQALQDSAVGSPLARDTLRSIPAAPSAPPFKVVPERTAGSALFEQGVPTLVSKNENRKIETQPSVAPISPPRVTISAPWPKSPRALSLKDSPSRAPVPEHLKAVWSQTSNKAEPPSINSLERIGDDLAPVPFTLSEVKSEDGETPPPTQASGHSRMSLHDVTRAFQQVPTSSINTNRTNPVTSPPTTHRQPVSHLPPPVPNGSVRPAYPGYPPPVVNSPSPTMVYSMPMAPSPIPRQMVVNGTQYGQPMWVQVPNGPPANGMMRPVAPGYGPQLIPYPPAGSIPMYMQGGVPPQMNGTQGRPPNMPVMSPMMSQAQATLPMYAGSPVLVHSAPVMRVPSGSPYPPPGQPRGQARGVYDQAPGMIPHSPAIHPQNAYSTIPSNSLDRSAW